MTDRELLEPAAKAAGYAYRWLNSDTGPELRIVYSVTGHKDQRWDRMNWNPLDDDGDALRLAVTLGIKFRWHAVLNQALAWTGSVTEILEVQENGEDNAGDKFAATRRAIVRAAAEIGKALP